MHVHVLVKIVLLLAVFSTVIGQREWSPWQSPWWNFENRYVFVFRNTYIKPFSQRDLVHYITTDNCFNLSKELNFVSNIYYNLTSVLN